MKSKSIDEMVLIPAGSFNMGSNAYKWLQPVHKVTISSFTIDRVPITQKMYTELMGANPSEFKEDPCNPVENVNWFDAIIFCNARSQRDGLNNVYQFTNVNKNQNGLIISLENLDINYSANGYRLPTEAEWEYSCRAGTTTDYYWGSYDEELGNYAWWIRNSNGKTHPVGLKLPNAWGLHDMVGNVDEWCNDWYAEDYYEKSPENNPTGPLQEKYRCRRGGGWSWINQIQLRSAERSYDFPVNRFNTSGLRCVLKK
jgi:formylglycine-generating enzyme required for sulfatase activity